MIKIIIPVLLLILIIIFWNKISEYIFIKFKIKINYVISMIGVVSLVLILMLLYF